MITKLYNPRTDKVRIRVRWPRFLRQFVQNVNWWLLLGFACIALCFLLWYGIACAVMAAF